MNLSTLCIKRPAFTIVINLVMVIVGIMGFMQLPVRWVPDVSTPQVSINTTYPGANARLVERDVTKIIEDNLSGISGIETLTSTSRQGESNINIKFKLGENMDRAVEDVRSSLERVRGVLPKTVQNPIVAKASSTTEAIMYISFSDTHRDERELSDYIDKYIVPAFETIDGVGSVGVFGKRVSALRIWLDPHKMAVANVTADEIATLLHEQNASIPSGQIRANDRYYSVITDTALNSAKQFNELILRNNQSQVLRLKDVGEANLEPEDADSFFRVNGKPGIALGITPQSIANPLDVEQRVLKKFDEMKTTLPNSMQAKILVNFADYIRSSIHNVYESFFEAVLFVWIVILAFLCSFRATLIPIVTIPVCLIASFALIAFLGFSLNTITLMAFVLAIGLVVDDAIVMLENISRHMEEGMNTFQAAIKGSKEMIFPVIAMTLTLAAVYAPIAFTQGTIGVLFREFTFTLAGAVIISGFVALTLTPMMSARILRTVNKEQRYYQWQTRLFNRLQTRYRKVLEFTIDKRKWVVLGLFIMAIIGLSIFKFIPSELAPAEDRNLVYVSIGAPHGASLNYTNNYAKQMEAIFDKYSDIKSYLTIAGMGSPSHVFQLLLLKNRHDRQEKTENIIKNLTAEGNLLSGVKVNVFPPSPPLADVAGSDDGDNLGLVLMTTRDYKDLQQVAKQLVDTIKPLTMFTHVDHSLKWDSEQFQINIDRDKASDLGVSIPAISNTLSTLIAGSNIGKMDESNILLQMKKSALANPNIFQELYVKNNAGKMIPLSSIVNITENSTSQVFRHYERSRADMIYLTLAPDIKISDAINVLQTIAKDNLPDDMKYTYSGEAKSFLESNGKTAFTFLLALIFIYLVLVAQFESFIDPLIILLTVPFAVIGALITLKLFGGTLNIYSNIGLITLVGLIAKHGILITDFANRERLFGKSINEAVITAAILRLRPIMMTTAAMVLGTLPLAFAFGPGAESRQQVGLVITGGLLFGTLFSLIVVPITYTFLAKFHKLTPEHLSQEDEHAVLL